MSQRIREVERDRKFEEYANREGDIVTGIIQQTDTRYTLLDLGRVEALLPQAEQVPFERPQPGDRCKAYIVEVRKTAKGPQIVVSRTHPGLIKRLFELEVPEIADGIVEIKACAREPGHRTKIAVWSQRPQRRPGRRLRRRPRRPCAHGRQRAARREDRHRPVQRGLRRLRRQGAVAGQGHAGHHQRRRHPGRRHRARPPAQPGDRPGGPERPPRRPPHRRAHRHPLRDPARRGRARRRRDADDVEYAEGEWVANAETGEMEWHAADGSVVSESEWQAQTEEPAADAAADEPGRRRRGRPTGDADEPSTGDELLADAEVLTDSRERHGVRGRRDRRPGGDDAGERLPNRDAERPARMTTPDRDDPRAPVRTCIGCRTRRPSDELVRVTRVRGRPASTGRASDAAPGSCRGATGRARVELACLDARRAARCVRPGVAHDVSGPTTNRRYEQNSVANAVEATTRCATGTPGDSRIDEGMTTVKG